MASFKFDPPAREGEAGRARFFWRIGRDQYNKTIAVKDEAAALRRKALIEECLLDIALGKRTVPAGVDVADFVVSGGVVPELPVKAPAPKKATLEELVAYYEQHIIKDAATRYTEDIHLAHLKRLIGESTALDSIDLHTAQKYADRRLKETAKGRQAPTKAGTVLKELKTLGIVWKWVASRPGAPTVPKNHPFRLGDIQFEAEDPKPPFRTWDEIERTIKRGGLTLTEIDSLWDCLYLDTSQVREVLAYVEEKGKRPFLYPMLCAAAHTGARRSELCRSMIDDWDLDAGIYQVRQKKKKEKTQSFTYRHIDLNTALKSVMRDWFVNHPGGHFAFCHDSGGKLRPDSASYYLTETLAGSKWEVVRGWHVFRHSFASNLARAGTDQRYIDAWMGHHTEIRVRYRHLFPEQRRNLIEALIA
jgi:integrase